MIKKKKGKNKGYIGKLGSETKTTNVPWHGASVSRKVLKLMEVPL
jgi:hypothetical protein